MPKSHPPLTAARLREMLSYDPETGIFRRLVGVSANAKAGDIAGSKNSSGYLQIAIDGRCYQAHRLAWLHVHGEWPAKNLDHVNGVRSNNPIANLREASHAENHQNRGINRNNTSGHPGVTWNLRDSKWRAEIKVSGRKHELGRFANIEDAIAARTKAKAAMHSFQPYDRDPQPKDAT